MLPSSHLPTIYSLLLKSSEKEDFKGLENEFDDFNFGISIYPPL